MRDKPGAEVYIHTNYWRSKNGYTDPTHKRFCTKRTFDYWIRGTTFFARYGAAYGGHTHPFARTSTRVKGGELVVILRKLASGLAVPEPRRGIWSRSRVSS